MVESFRGNTVDIGSSDGPEEDYETGVLKDLESGSSPIEHLELRECRFRNGDVRNILRISKALKTFIYEIGGVHLSYCPISFSALYEGLQRHKGPLENLWLDTTHGMIGFMEELDDTTPLKPLEDFSNLAR